MKNKSSRKVKILSIILTGLLLIACFTTACQPTPEEEIVIQKDEEALKEAIEEPVSTDAAVYEYISSWTESIVNATGTISVDINAEVFVPNNGVMPIASVAPAEISEEMVETMINVFGQGNSFYETGYTKTKDELETEILELKKWLASPTGDLYDGREAYPDKWEAYYENKQSQLEQLEEEILTAPEESDNQILQPVYQDVADDITDEMLESLEEEDREAVLAARDSDNVYQSIKGICDLGKEDEATLYVNKSPDNYRNYAEFDNCDYSLFSPPLEGSYTSCINDDFSNAQDLGISLEEAQAQAVDLMEQLGIEGMGLSDVSVIAKAEGMVNIADWEDAYRFIFTKEVNNVLVTYQVTDVLAQEAYDVPWPYEYVEICIDDTGILSFIWNAPSEILEVLAANVELMEFSEIQNTFKEYILIKTSLDDNAVKTDIVIDEIRLGLMRIKSNQSESGYMFVPVWDFFGYRVNTYNGDTRLLVDENNQYMLDVYGYSYLTINALDGTIIDRSLGY